MADAIVARTARFATPTSEGNVDWTTTDMQGLTPKAVMIIANHADTDGTAEAGAAQGVGFATGTSNENSATWSSKDAVGTSVVGESRADTVISLFVDGSVQVAAEFVSFITNGVRLNFTSVDSDAQLFTVIFFAGDDLSAIASTVTMLTEDTAVNHEGVGFEADLLFACSDMSDGNAASSYGVCVNDGSETQYCIGQRSANNQGTTIVETELVNNRIGSNSNGFATRQFSFQVSAFDSLGFTLTGRDGNTNNQIVNYLALNFGGSANAWVGGVNSPTSIGDDAQTGPGFKPQFVMLGMTDARAENTIEADADANSFGISAFDEDGNEFSNAWADEDAVTTTNTQSLADNQAVNFHTGAGVAQHAATFSTMDALGWTLNYSVADGTVRKGFGVAIGGVTFTSANLALHHSGASDIGGAIGAVLTDDALNNIWDDVSSADASAGDTEYRCAYVKNTHSSLSVLNVSVEINTDPTESNWEIALGAAGKNGTETAVANENTAPSGPVFGTTPLTIGTLAAGDFYPIWIKRIVSAGAGAATPDSGVLNILGDDPN